MAKPTIDLKKPEISQDLKNWLETLAKVRGVVNRMKMEPMGHGPLELNPKTDGRPMNAIKMVGFPEEGGVMTYIDGYDLPYRGFPYIEIVDRLDEIKKLISITFQRFIPYAKKLSWFKKLTLLLAYPHFKKLGEVYLYASWGEIQKNRLKPTMYCQFVREIYRVFEETRYSRYNDYSELWTPLRDVSCMGPEFDNAYRYRFQDTLSGIDKQVIVLDPIKEVHRIFDRLIERETIKEGKNPAMWAMIRDVVCLYLKKDKRAKLLIQEFLSKIDLKQVALSKEDKCFCDPRKDYDFGYKKSIIK